MRTQRGAKFCYALIEHGALGFEHDAPVRFTERSCEVFAQLIQPFLELFGGDNATALDEVESSSQPALQVSYRSEFLNCRRDPNALTLNGSTAQTKLDVLQVWLEHT